MRRDPELLRAILECIEAHDGVTKRVMLDHNNFRATKAQVDYHLRLLLQAGYIRGEPVTNVPVAEELTWQGHEFLEGLRRTEIGRKLIG